MLTSIDVFATQYIDVIHRLPLILLIILVDNSNIYILHIYIASTDVVGAEEFENEKIICGCRTLLTSA